MCNSNVVRSKYACYGFGGASYVRYSGCGGHRRINYANDKLLLCLSKLKELIPTSLLDTLTTTADKRANKTTEQHHAIVQSKLTRLQHAAHKKRHKTDKNWVRNISSRPLDENETQVLSYGLKHSVTPKRIPTDDIVSSVESVLARQRELAESTKDDIRSRIASTLQSASLTDCNLTKDELHALRRLRNDKDIVILPADKGRVTVVMDKKDYTDKMDSLVNDKQTYEPLKRDPTPALQRRLNGKLLDLKKTETIDIHYTTDSDAAYRNQLNFTDYLNYTSLRYLCDP